jgi:antirestriction protein ArdC
MEQCLIDIRHGGDRAFFSLSGNYVQMPEPGSFKSGAAYYATLLHEWYHWTGHSSRENRTFGAVFGDDEYAMEELRAESLSVLAGMALGLPIWIENHAAYLQSWAKKLDSSEGVKEIIKGINEAGRMLDVILAVRNGVEPDVEWWPEVEEEMETSSALS